MKAIEIINLTKSYKDKLVLNDVSLNIEKWDFFWLLWHNWAWKTTLIWIITDLVKKNKWTVKIMWNDIDKHFTIAKKHIGIVPQEFNFDIFMKVKDIILTQAWYYWVPYILAVERLKSILEKLNLRDKRDQTARVLSWWMKRRLMIARALIHDPDIIILDEPTAWVDVELRKSMWEFLTEINQNWKTILLTTHYLEEAEKLCNKIAIINNWIIIENSFKNELLWKLQEEIIIIELNKNIDTIPDWFKDFNPILINWNRIEITYNNKLFTINDIILILEQQGIKAININNKTNRLEQLFINITKNV